MNILQNNKIVERQTSNYILGEISNIAAVVQDEQAIVDYYPICEDCTVRVNGVKSLHDFVSSTSETIYDKVLNVPMAGLSGLRFENEWDEEMGFDASFESEALVFPNTVDPKPGDIFVLQSAIRPMLFMIYDVRHVMTHDLSFIGVSYRVYNMTQDKLNELEQQVRNVYRFIVSNIGTNKNSVVLEESYFTIQDHVKNYMDLIELYTSIFYDEHRGLVVFRGIYDNDHKGVSVNCTNTDPVLVTKPVEYQFVDMMLMKLMFNEGIISYDDIITYSNNNYNTTHPMIYTDMIPYIDNYKYKSSFLYKLLQKKNKKSSMKDFEEIFIAFKMEDSQMGQNLGLRIYISEGYLNFPIDNNICFDLVTVFTPEFIYRIFNNKPYEPTDCLNYELHNIIIAYYNHEEVDFENLTISGDRTGENYYLIPLLLYIYKQHIASLK